MRKKLIPFFMVLGVAVITSSIAFFPQIASYVHAAPARCTGGGTMHTYALEGMYFVSDPIIGGQETVSVGTQTLAAYQVSQTVQVQAQNSTSTTASFNLGGAIKDAGDSLSDEVNAQLGISQTVQMADTWTVLRTQTQTQTVTTPADSVTHVYKGIFVDQVKDTATTIIGCQSAGPASYSYFEAPDTPVWVIYNNKLDQNGNEIWTPQSTRMANDVAMQRQSFPARACVTFGPPPPPGTEQVCDLGTLQ